MTIRLIKIFLEVFKVQNITKASINLHMTQPAVTRAIKQIEEYYGVCLFERINHKLLVTETGKMLYSYALHIVDTFDEMEKSLRDWDSFGILRIGASITLGNTYLVDIVPQFNIECPNIKVHCTIRNSNDLQQSLIANDLDIALIEGTVNEHEIVSQELATDGLVLIVPPSHPLLLKDKIYLEDLSKYDFILRESGSAVRTYIDNIFIIKGITMYPAWESVSTQAIIKAVSKGLGISILPKMLTKNALNEGSIKACNIQDESLSRKFFVAWHKNKYLTQSAKKFIELCENYN